MPRCFIEKQLINVDGKSLSEKSNGICYHWNREACPGFTKKLFKLMNYRRINLCTGEAEKMFDIENNIIQVLYICCICRSCTIYSVIINQCCKCWVIIVIIFIVSFKIIIIFINIISMIIFTALTYSGINSIFWNIWKIIN